MEIHGLGGASGPQSIFPRIATHTVEAPNTPVAAAVRDQVEISALGRALDGLSQISDIRHEKVAEIRHQIASGAYETPAKLEAAIDRLLDSLIG